MFLRQARRKKIKEIEKNDEDKSVEIGKINESITALKFANVQLQEDMFDYFEKLLSPELTAKWRVIFKEECEGVNYVSLSGTPPGVIWG